MTRTIGLILVLLLCLPLLAHYYVPGQLPEHPILLKGGDLYTVSNGVLEQTDLLIVGDRIAEIGKNLAPPASAEIIDVSGKRVYPGLIEPATTIGLVEIGEVRATVDSREVGRIHPEVQAHVAYNPDSEIIPTTRATGVTTALIVPRGGVIAGRSSLLNLDGWTWEDAAEKLDLGLHVNWPRERIVNAWWMEESAEEQRENNAENRRQLTEAFAQAKAYALARAAGADKGLDTRWEAMLPALNGEMPLFIQADDYGQIEQAIHFAHENQLRLVLVGGKDSWQVADLLAARDIPVILGQTQSLPAREDEPYDLPYSCASLLDQAGVKFCFSSEYSATGARNLPFQAGQAVAGGLGQEAALRAVTLSTAEILGVADQLGSLETDKKATVVVSAGDILNPLTAKVEMVFIGGKPVDLNSRHLELYKKYRTRLQQ
ncbi:MAG: amidohydrolase [bacterium]